MYQCINDAKTVLDEIADFSVSDRNIFHKTVTLCHGMHLEQLAQLVVLVFGQYGKININPACGGGVVGNVIRGEVGEKLWLFLGSVMFSALGVA